MEYNNLITLWGDQRDDFRTRVAAGELPVDVIKSYNRKSNTLSINWALGNTCTYKCSYCTPEHYGATNPWPPVEKALEIVAEINRVYKEHKTSIVWELIGGEVTVWKDIEKFVTELKKYDNNYVRLVTNGARSVRWWDQYGGMFSDIVYSFHPEFADKDHCLEVCNLLDSKGVKTGALVLALASKWEYVVETYELLKEKGTFAVLAKKPIRENYKSDDIGSHLRMVTYTQEQLEWLRQDNTIIRKQSTSMGSGITFRYNETDYIKSIPEAMAASGENSWTGWKCNVGIDVLYIGSNGMVSADASCRQGKVFGNYLTDNCTTFDWTVEPTVCKVKHCFCSHDVRAAKWI